MDNQDAVTARLSMAKIYSDIRNQENGHYNLSFAMKQLQLLDTLNNKDIDRNYDRIQMAISRIYADKIMKGVIMERHCPRWIRSNQTKRDL